jgi:hypothetical protein
MKTCSKCGQNKETGDFYPKRSQCKPCVSKHNASYREANPDVASKNKREYYRNNCAELAISHKKWLANNTERVREAQKNYNREKLRQDINFKLAANLRSRVASAVKHGSAVRDLGCSIEYFREYISRQFKEGMTWENHGRMGWHLDHIKPLASFNLSNPTECGVAMHYSNYQPLWWYENLSKGSR